MDGLLPAIGAELRQTSPAEVAAILLAVGYLLLAIRQNIWCWFCAGVSTAIYVVLFAAARLYMEAALNVFYFGMAVYGWWAWRHGGQGREELPVTVWPWRVHAAAIAVITMLTLGAGRLLDSGTDAVYPYIDSATTFAAVWTTFLVARKVLENWWYWLVIDSVSVVIYWLRDLELTALLFVAYVVMIPFGIAAWTRSWREDRVVA